MKRLSHLAINDDGFAFDPATGDSYVLNPTARLIVMGLKEGKAPADIAAGLAERFEVAKDDAEADMADFKERLRAYGLM